MTGDVHIAYLEMRDRLLITARRTVLLLIATTTFPVLAASSSYPAGDVEVGRRIYLEGMLPAGVPLKGVRQNGTAVEGAEAACASCHRRSGMGSVEGDIQVPPITGKALYGNGDKVIATMDPRSGKAWNQTHDPYTDETLATAIRTGVNVGGREMNTAMPRYALNTGEMDALAAYLRQLSSHWSPGVTADAIRFATVITPEVAPERRKVVLDMMRAAFAQKNGSTVTRGQAGGRRHMVSAAEMVLGTERNWVLDVWELQGPPETWGGQLDEHYRRQPVFAVVSGLSGGSWQSVHDFCEREQVPCWFPSVDLPAAVQGFYPVYFSQGVALEAEVLAAHLLARTIRPRRVVQVHRDEAASNVAAQALAQALSGSGIKVEDRVLARASSDALRHVLKDVNDGDAAMLWLHPDELAMLGKVAPSSGIAYFSGRLAGGGLAAFPAAWKGKARLLYPYELPDRRETNLAYLHQWLKLRSLPLVDEALQSEVYFSLAFLTDTVSEMLDNLYRDYLMERAESMVSRREASKSEEEARARDALRQPARSALIKVSANLVEARSQAVPAGKGGGTTVYPHLSLGPTQRFASKGAYIVRFDGDALVAETGWIVP